MRAILYARTSGDDRDRGSLDAQIEMCRAFAISQGYTVVSEVKEDDKGARGAEMDLPGLNRALEMARTGDFDVLVVRELDRFARRLAKQLIIEEEFKRAGVKVEYVIEQYDDSPEGNLMKNVRAVVAEYEALKISQRMTRGRRRNVKSGSVMVNANPPYGYRPIQRDGRRVLEIYEPEAQIVRLIYTWYIEGDGTEGPMTIAEITQKLSKMGVPTWADTWSQPKNKKRGWGEWSRSTVYQILRNETYAGTWHYGKRTAKKANSPEHLIAVSVPAIVSRETWEAAQERRRQNRLDAPRNTRGQFLLRRRVLCGCCGLKMLSRDITTTKNKQHYMYYHCPSRRKLVCV